MKHLTERPLLTVCGAYVAVTVFLVTKYVPVPLWAVLSELGLCLLLLAGSLLFRGKGHLLTGLFLLSFGICMGIGTGYARNTLRYGHVIAYAGKTCRVTGTVGERDHDSSGFSSYTVRIKEADGRRESFTVKLSAQQELGCRYGDSLSFTAVFSLPEETLQGFPLRKYCAGKGIYLAAEAMAGEKIQIEEGKKTFLTVLHTFSNKTAARARLLFGRDLGGLCSGILLGRRDDIPDSIRRDFSDLGISHVLAVSGMHLSVIVGGLFLLLKWLRWHRGVVFTVTSLFTLTFMALTGFSPSVVRSGIMMFVMLLACYIGRNEDLPVALFFSCSVLLLFSPDSAADAGFLLSFSSTLGLITLGRALSVGILTGKHKKGPALLWRGISALLAPAAVTASAILFTLPVTCLYFGSLSTVGLLSNLLFVPLLTMLLYGTVCGLIGYYPAVLLTRGLGKGILYGAEKCAALLPPPVRLTADEVLIASAAAVLSLLTVGILYFVFRNVRRLTALFLVPLAVWGGAFAFCRLRYRGKTAEQVTVGCLTLKENDYIGVQSGKFLLLCDISDGSRRNLTYAADLFGETFREVSPDALLLTHLHTKHIRSFSLFADSCRLRTLYLPSSAEDGEENALAGLLREADRRGIAVIRYDPDTPILFDGFSLSAGAPMFLDRSVQPLLSLRIDTEEASFVYLSKVLTEADNGIYAAHIAEGTGALWLGVHGVKSTEPVLPFLSFADRLLLSDRDIAFLPKQTNGSYLTEGTVRTFVLSDPQRQ